MTIELAIQVVVEYSEGRGHGGIRREHCIKVVAGDMTFYPSFSCGYGSPWTQERRDVVFERAERLAEALGGYVVDET